MVIRQGSQLNFTVSGIDSDAVEVVFLAKNASKTITATVTPTDNTANFEIDDTDTVGEYDYQITVKFATGNPDIYPEGCTECSFPKLIICKSLEP